MLVQILLTAFILFCCMTTIMRYSELDKIPNWLALFIVGLTLLIIIVIVGTIITMVWQYPFIF